MRWQQITWQQHFTYANIFSATWEQHAGLLSISSPFKTEIKETLHHILFLPFSFLSFIHFEICTGIRSRLLLTWQCLLDLRSSFAFSAVCLLSSSSHFHWRTHYDACGAANYLGIFRSPAAVFPDCQWPGCSTRGCNSQRAVLPLQRLFRLTQAILCARNSLWRSITKVMALIWLIALSGPVWDLASSLWKCNLLVAE